MAGTMKHVDMRSLTPEAQEERRRQVIGLRQAGRTYGAIAAQVGLTQTGVFDICKRVAEHGPAGLKSKSCGPASGYGCLLTTGQEAEIQALIRKQMPDALGLDFALWSRAAALQRRINRVSPSRTSVISVVPAAAQTRGHVRTCWGPWYSRKRQAIVENTPITNGFSDSRIWVASDSNASCRYAPSCARDATIATLPTRDASMIGLSGTPSYTTVISRVATTPPKHNSNKSAIRISAAITGNETVSDTDTFTSAQKERKDFSERCELRRRQPML